VVVKRLSEFTNSASHLSPVQACEDAIRELNERQRGAFNADCKKLLILSLDERDGQYKVSFIQAGMKMSECVALCEIAKNIFKEQMNY
jgi:hypothetical protein